MILPSLKSNGIRDKEEIWMVLTNNLEFFLHCMPESRGEAGSMRGMLSNEVVSLELM